MGAPFGEALLHMPQRCGTPKRQLQSYFSTPTSFSRYSAVEENFKDLSEGFTNLLSKLSESARKLPEAVKTIKEDYAHRSREERLVLQEAKGKSEIIREKISTFNIRLEKAMEQALVFTDIVKQQHDYAHNELPPELVDDAGTLVSTLTAAKKFADTLEPQMNLLKIHLATLSASTSSSLEPSLTYLALQLGEVLGCVTSGGKLAGAPHRG
eukprot:CAMPEP_0117526202 /NCGR_PEP_ID=MMETSP0784-20121206/36164_1 /TAXON_ID=39447 /ORGANISM="" /LENGTH=210 /DNA_ID=CAMNT_0005322423 /DNA_START=142 /DNA_END=770 /DNA_ORIENTATION=-